MSGGGGGGSGTEAAATGTTPYARAPAAQTIQPTMPGFQNMLVNQLMAGFGSGGGTGGDLAAMLGNLYKPMTAYSFQEPISVTRASYDKSKHAPISTGNPILDRLLMGETVDVGNGEAKK